VFKDVIKPRFFWHSGVFPPIERTKWETKCLCSLAKMQVQEEDVPIKYEGKGITI
jgi:hypothetical protein